MKERARRAHGLFQNSTIIFGERPAMRRLVLSSLFVVVALVFLYQASHAHAHEPTRCGFWSSMEAGMSCE